MEIIIPAAGLSSRFPNMRPKYTLTEYSGVKMIDRAIESFVGQHPITIGVLEQHHQEFPIDQYLAKKYGNSVRVVVLKQLTKGPADTVRKIIEVAGLDPTQELLIKDCDSFFNHTIAPGNYICTSSIADHEVLKRLGSKSFVVANNQGIVTDIIEKQVVSDKFCVGGYKFDSIELFCRAFDAVSTQHVSEIFVSHVIQKCLEWNEVFAVKAVSNYVDVGTADDWFEHNDKSVIFCDIDGTIIQAQRPDELGTTPVPMVNAVQRLRQLEDAGHQLIFTTARYSEFHDQTVEMLQELGFKEFNLVTGLLNGARILINDYNDANPYPRATAINVRRDQDNLTDYL